MIFWLPLAWKSALYAPWAMAAPGCWNKAMRLVPSELVVIWRTPTMAVAHVVAVSISMSLWFAAMAGRSEGL